MTTSSRPLSATQRVARIAAPWLVFLLSCIAFSTFFSACSPATSSQDAGTTPIDAGPGQKALVLSRQDQSGHFSIIDVKTQQVIRQAGPASNDAVARYWQGYFFIINRLTHDNIQVMKASDFSLVKQYSVKPKSNPQDIAIIDAQKAYVSRLASTALLIVEPLTGKVRGEIDLSKLAETGDKDCKADTECGKNNRCLQSQCTLDGYPELAAMTLVDDKLLVLVQRLNRNKRFAPVTKGLLAVIDTKSDKLIRTVELAASNPIAMQRSTDGKSLYIALVGAWDDGTGPHTDGQIQKLSLPDLTPQGSILKESTLGGNIGSFTVLSPTRAYVIRSGKDWKTELIFFNPSTGKIKQTIASSPCLDGLACFTFHQVRHNTKGELYLVDRNLKNPGIRVFDATTGKEHTRAPLQVGLPPSSVLFYEQPGATP